MCKRDKIIVTVSVVASVAIVASTVYFQNKLVDVTRKRRDRRIEEEA